jgi:hypothetical protein
MGATGRLWAINIRSQTSGIGRSAPVGADWSAPQFRLYVGLLSHFQGVVHLNAEVTDRALQLRVPEEDLNGPQVLRPAVDQGCLRPPERMRP